MPFPSHIGELLTGHCFHCEVAINLVLLNNVPAAGLLAEANPCTDLSTSMVSLQEGVMTTVRKK